MCSNQSRPVQLDTALHLLSGLCKLSMYAAHTRTRAVPMTYSLCTRTSTALTTCHARAISVVAVATSIPQALGSSRMLQCIRPPSSSSSVVHAARQAARTGKHCTTIVAAPTTIAAAIPLSVCGVHSSSTRVHGSCPCARLFSTSPHDIVTHTKRTTTSIKAPTAVVHPSTSSISSTDHAPTAPTSTIWAAEPISAHDIHSIMCYRYPPHFERNMSEQEQTMVSAGHINIVRVRCCRCCCCCLSALFFSHMMLCRIML